MARSTTRHRHGIIHAVLVATAVLCVAVAQHSAFACGLNWNEPQSHFQGVSFQGYVFHVEDFGKIDLGKELQLPLRVIFRSESNASSPYVGQGWDIPLLESHIVQIDDRWFKMIEPTGLPRLFWRDEKDPTFIHGQGGWKGQIKGNTITTWADCGSKIVFNTGKITQLQIKDRTFEYQYSGNRVSEIREGGRTLLKVDSDPIAGIVNGLSYGEQQIRIELGDKPQVEVIDGQKIVASMRKSLGKLTLSDGTTKEYEYAVNEKLQPTLNIAGAQKRVIVWHPSSKTILRDADWTYEVTPGELPGSNAAIDRSNPTQEKEFWHYDALKGQEITRNSSGVTRVKTWFTSGSLSGKPRKTYLTTPTGTTQILEQNYYDEEGRLLKQRVGNSTVVYATEGHGKVAEIRIKDQVFYKDGKILETAINDNNDN